MKNNNKTLLILSIIEVITLFITIFAIAASFEAAFTQAFADLTSPWISGAQKSLDENTIPTAVIAVSIIGRIAFTAFIVSNIIRFIKISKYKKAAFIVGIVLLTGGYSLYLHYISDLLFMLFFIPSVVLIIYSHLPDHTKKQKTYDENKCYGMDMENISENQKP
jgi:hypothetical protein